MKILIIKLGALGDIIMSTSVIRQIQSYHAGSEIHLLTTPEYQDLFKFWDSIVIKAIARKGVGNVLVTLWWLRSHRFDRIYDLQSNDRTTIICALSGIPFRAGNHPRFPYTHHPATKYKGQCHAFNRLNEIIVSAGLDPANDVPSLPIDEKCRETVRTWLADNELFNTRFALLHAGANRRHPQKRWPYFSALSKQLVKQNINVIWIGASDDREINETLAKQTGTNATGLFNIPELIALGEQSLLAVTNDSAPMHILSCSGIPVFGLFGPTDWTRTYALGQKNNVISASMILNSNIPHGHSIDVISADTVMKKIHDHGLLKNG